MSFLVILSYLILAANYSNEFIETGFKNHKSCNNAPKQLELDVNMETNQKETAIIELPSQEPNTNPPLRHSIQI